MHNHASTHHSVFHGPDPVPAAQTTASNHWRQFAKKIDILMILPKMCIVQPSAVEENTLDCPYSNCSTLEVWNTLTKWLIQLLDNSQYVLNESNIVMHKTDIVQPERQETECFPFIMSPDTENLFSIATEHLLSGNALQPATEWESLFCELRFIQNSRRLPASPIGSVHR